MEVHPPTEVEVAELATQIYQTNVTGSNLAGEAEKSALRVANLCGKVTTTKQLIVSCSRAVSWVHQLMT